MRRASREYLILASLIAAITISGCTVLAPQPDRAKYFVLAPIPASGGGAAYANGAAGKSITIGVGPVTIPRYLERPEVVTRVSETELSVSDTERWAEPLETGVSSTLRRDLADRLAGAQIISFPWSRKQPIDYRVKVNFHGLECTAAGNAVVDATWTIQRESDGATIQSGSTAFSAPAGKDERSASAALSRGIAQVGTDISHALGTLAATHTAARPSPSS